MRAIYAACDFVCGVIVLTLTLTTFVCSARLDINPWGAKVFF